MLAAFLFQFLVGLTATSFIDTSTEAGMARLASWQGYGFLAAWVGLGYAFWRTGTARRAWGWSLLTCGIFCLASPIATLIGTAGIVGRSTTDAGGVGAGIGAGIATVAVGFVGFFFAAIFLVLAFVLLRGGKPAIAAG